MATKSVKTKNSGFAKVGDASRRAIIGDQYVDGMLREKNPFDHEWQTFKQSALGANLGARYFESSATQPDQPVNAGRAWSHGRV